MPPERANIHRGQWESTIVSISKTPERSTTLDLTDVQKYIQHWCESNTFEEEGHEGGYEDRHGHKLAQLCHRVVIDFGFHPKEWKEENRIKIVEAVAEELYRWECFCLDLNDLMESALKYWDGVRVPLGYDTTVGVAAQAVKKTTMPPGAYLGSQANACRFLWHMLQLLPDDENYGVGVKYLSCGKAAELACRYNLMDSKNKMAISRAFDALRRNGVIEVVSVGGFRGKKPEASRFRVLQKEPRN